MHFAFNMLVLHIYGDNIENYLGRTKYIILLLGGMAAAFFQAIFSRGLDVPMIGASGCIAGIMGAYFVLYPKARINVFMWFIIFIQTINSSKHSDRLLDNNSTYKCNRIKFRWCRVFCSYWRFCIWVCYN